MKKILIFLFFISVLLSPIQKVFADPPKAAVDLYNAGIDYYNSGYTEKSIEAFKKAIEISPKFYEAYYNLVQIQVAANKYDDAIKSYTVLTELDPDDDESTYEFGNLLYKRGYLKRSLTYLDRIPSDSIYYDKAQTLVDKILVRQKQLEEAAIKATTEKKAEQNQGQNINPKPNETMSGNRSTIYAGIPNPSGVAADSLGNIYIASYSENIIYKINSNNQKSVFVSSNALSGPIGLAVDGDNNLYVANYGMSNILKVTPNGAPSVFLNVKKPYCVSIGGVDNKILYVTEQDSDTTIRFQL